MKDGELQKPEDGEIKLTVPNGSDSILPTLWQADEHEPQIGSDIC